MLKKLIAYFLYNRVVTTVLLLVILLGGLVTIPFN